MQTRIDYFNKCQPQADIYLKGKQWAAMTYGAGLRMGDDDGEFFSGLRSKLSEDCLITTEHQGKVEITLYHGRTDPDEELGEWGFNADKPLTADGVHLRPEGLYLLDFSGKKAKARLIPFFEDMLVWGGNYYGDVSIQLPERG